jgi:hypothetical protein
MPAARLALVKPTAANVHARSGSPGKKAGAVSQ